MGVKMNCGAVDVGNDWSTETLILNTYIKKNIIVKSENALVKFM